jgi:peptide/nickel transport system permease protein
MPSVVDIDDDQFGTSVWMRVRASVRPVLVVVSLAMLLAGFITSYEPQRPDGGTVSLLGNEIVLLDWITLCAGLVALFALGPLVVRRRRDIPRVVRQFFRDRVAGVAALVLLGLVLLGTVGVHTVARSAFEPTFQYTPPAGVSVENFIPTQCDGTVTDGTCRGGTEFLLGTDGSGGDMLSAVVHGLRTSLQVGVSAAVIAGGIGMLVGLVAGTVGGRTDTILMRYVDLQMAIPSFFVYVLLTLIVRTPGDLALMVVVFGLLSWGGLAKLVRSEVLQVREQLYVTSAQAAGGSSLYRLRRHVLPNVSTSVLVPLTTLVPLYVLYEASLSFLELGASENERVSLGAKIADGFGSNAFSWWDIWWVAVFPALAVTALTVTLLLVGDRVSEMLDPRSR